MKLAVWCITALLLASHPAFAAEGARDQPLADPVLEARARALQKELRCVVCKVQSIEESNAPLAADLRQLIRERIAAGQTNQQIKDFLVGNYGAFILMEPPIRGDTYLLWFGPALLVLVGAGVVLVTVARARKRSAGEDLNPEPETTHN